MNQFISTVDLDSSLEFIKQSPKHEGVIELIVCRPQTNARQELTEAELTIHEGLVGDIWRTMLDKGINKYVNPDTQLALINSRVISAITQNKNNWKLAGDQFYVDFDLGKDNLPVGARLKIGSAIIEVTKEPHLACSKFSKRFGKDAVRFVNSSMGKSLNLRGIYARVISPGKVELGSCIKKLEA